MDGFSEDAVHGRLKPYHGDLAQVVTAAWRRWTTQQLPGLPAAFIRTRRTVMYDLMAQEARQRFDGHADLQLVEDEQYERVLLLVPSLGSVGQLVLRFKHVDNQKKTSNYPTAQAIAFDAQQSLPSVPNGLRLTVGYVLSLDETELREIVVVRAIGERIIWEYPITPGKVDELPQRTLDQAARRVAARIKAKPGVRRRGDESVNE